MKNKCSDLKRLWDRASKQGTASKAQKISSTSTPTPTSIEVENRVEDQNVNNPPSNELQLALVQTHNNSGREPEIGSPIVEDEELDEELDDEAVYVLEPDPGKRIPIINYDVNDQDLVRRRYIAMGACQPKKHEFRTTKIGGNNRRFSAHWFDTYEWLEYSVELDVVFCFVCYLFKDKTKHKGQNQEMGLGRPCETRWGSHSKTVSHVVSLYPSIQKVLKRIGKEYNSAEGIGVQTMLRVFESFEFVFMLHLMEELFGYTDGLSQALQRRDQDIVNAIDLISLTKQQLLNLREDSGWGLFLQNVKSFCLKHKIKVPDMDGFYKPVQRSKKFYKNMKNLHRFRIDMFLALIDRQLQELNSRFDEVNTELLVCMASFNPIDSFAAYDQEKLVKLAQFYPSDFSKTEMLKLPYQLSMFVADVRRDQRFRKVKNIAQLSAMLVETKKSISYDIVYKLLKLVLILPVATASVERIFSSMNYVKNKLRAKMGEQYLNDCLVTFLERKFFMQVKEDAIISRFQKGDRRVIL